jgi:D-beta-D-heptose 7-phosphate kinase/D-beta-D-heptose 1-phosphate adenosyltransferase
VTTTPREVFDVTGAGDMVVAMLGVALADRYELRTAVELANVAAGVEVGKIGAVAVTRREMLAAIDQLLPTPAGILPLPELLRALESHRASGSKIVFTNGCFDVLHAGHARYLRRARGLGDVLVVGLNSDASVRRLKGADRPVNPCSDRAELLAGLACVDFVVEFDADTPLALIQELLPDVLVKGMDWKDKGVVGREVVEARGGQVVLVDLLEGRSTTGIVERIRGGSFRAESGRP